jgi:hypothetical protein
MQTITTIGLDIAKSVFQVHGVDAEGNVILRRQIKRRYVLAFFERPQPCHVGIEACASSHHWSRELEALGSSLIGRLGSSAFQTSHRYGVDFGRRPRHENEDRSGSLFVKACPVNGPNRPST